MSQQTPKKKRPKVVRSGKFAPPATYPDSVVKHPWGIVCISSSEKVSYPWSEIVSITEEIRESIDE